MADNINGTVTLGQAEKMLALFPGNERSHGAHSEPKWDEQNTKWSLKECAKTLAGPASVDDWMGHLQGTKPLGVVPLLDNGTTKWASIDYDKYNEDMMELVKTVYARKLPLVPVLSKSSGLHLFMFFKEFEDAEGIRTLLTSIAADLGVSGSEIFPKQHTLDVEKKGFGNWLCMPYLGTDFDGKLCDQFGIKEGGMFMSLEAFLMAAENAKVTLAEVSAKFGGKSGVGRGSRKYDGKPGGGASATYADFDWQKADVDSVFGDGPPCLLSLARAKVPNGARNNFLSQCIVFLKKKFSTSWEVALDWVNMMVLQVPGSSDDMHDFKKRFKAKEYDYMHCKNSPTVDFCNVAICRLKRYGVGASGGPAFSLGDVSLVKMNSDPPIYFVTAHGIQIKVSADALLTARTFMKEVFTEANVVIPVMKSNDWITFIRSLTQDMEIVEPSVGLEKGAGYAYTLGQFLAVRNRDDMLVPKKSEIWTDVWVHPEEQRFYFPLEMFLQYMSRQTGTDADRVAVVSFLESIGGSYDPTLRRLVRPLRHDADAQQQGRCPRERLRRKLARGSVRIFV